MSINPRHFVVSAQSQGGIRTASRGMAASAMVLADLWADQGCADITLTDKDGQAHTRDSFRTLLQFKGKRRLGQVVL